VSQQHHTDEVPLSQRIAENPRPAASWALAGAALIVVELGALLDVIFEFLLIPIQLLPGKTGMGAVKAIESAVEELPTLLSRSVFPNQGYYNGEAWVNTFLGLEPKWAWVIRVVLVYLYALIVLLWLWNGYERFREHYRYADWTPRDDIVDRFRNHRWGQFGMIVVFIFVVMAVFAPVLSPTTLEQNVMNPYSYSIQYFNEDTNSVEEIVVGVANIQSSSQGAGGQNVGPWQYDDFGRFHPFGTVTTGKDLFTLMAFGARISLSIAVVSLICAGLIALALAMATSYYKGLADLLVVLTSDSIQAIPFLMLLILVAVVFSGTWLSEFYDGAVLMIAIFTLFYWPFLWRILRGPALQVSEQEWIDAAKSFGEKPSAIMRKHMAPYVIGYLLVYASMSLGGIIIAIAGLSYLGLGINPPTPEWGRVISSGQPYVATASWHISLIPGILITLLVTGFNALGDGVRDAIDPKSDTGDTSSEVAAAGGSGA
jgi:peptide/nickel transport system permease protein